MGINQYIKIGSKIKKARISKGIRQNDMAEKLELSVSTYSNYENNYREPKLDIVEKICSILDMTIDELMDFPINGTESCSANPLHYDQSYSYASSEELDKRFEQQEKQEEEAAKRAPKFVTYDENGNEIKDGKVPKFTGGPSMSIAEAIAEAEAIELERLQAAYKRLNRKGKAKAVERVEELTEVSRYTKEDPPIDPFFMLSKKRKKR